MLYGRELSQRVKGIVFKVYVRTAFSYGAENWAIRVKYINRLETNRMTMLQMICGKNSKGKAHKCVFER